MPVTRQTQVLGHLEHLAGKALGKAAKAYRKGVIGPMVGRIKKAKSVKGLLRQLGPGLLRDMDSGVVEKALTEADVQTAAIGRVTATPAQTLKRRNVETSKRRNVSPYRDREEAALLKSSGTRG